MNPLEDFKLFDTILDYDPANTDPITNPPQTSTTDKFPVDPLGLPVFVIRRTVKKDTSINFLKPV